MRAGKWLIVVVCVVSVYVALRSDEGAAKEIVAVRNAQVARPAKVGPYIVTVDSVTAVGSGDRRSVASCRSVAIAMPRIGW